MSDLFCFLDFFSFVKFQVENIIFHFFAPISHEKMSNFKTHFEKAKIGVKMFLWEINLFLYVNIPYKVSKKFPRKTHFCTANVCFGLPKIALVMDTFQR